MDVHAMVKSGPCSGRWPGDRGFSGRRSGIIVTFALATTIFWIQTMPDEWTAKGSACFAASGWYSIRFDTLHVFAAVREGRA